MSRAEGRAVRYIRSTWVPGDARVMWLFEAADAGLVGTVSHSAWIPFSRVVEAAVDVERPAEACSSGA